MHELILIQVNMFDDPAVDVASDRILNGLIYGLFDCHLAVVAAGSMIYQVLFEMRYHLSLMSGHQYFRHEFQSS